MKVVYGRRAQRDLMELFDYIAAQDPDTAAAVEMDIRAACEGLGLFPYANVATDIPRVYRMPLPKRGYTIFYRVNSNSSLVQVAAHRAQLPRQEPE